MKTQIIKLYSLLFIALFLISSCDTPVNKTGEKKADEKKADEKKEGGIIVGNFSDNTKTSANLSISLDDASKLMHKYNRLTQQIFTYTYTRAWIEIIETEKNKYSYYLGLEANLESKNNEKAYSCYSIYTELEVNNANLEFYANAIQHTCTGKCCGNCKLVLFKNKLGCECNSTSKESGCEGHEKCKHNISEVPTPEEIKNDMI